MNNQEQLSMLVSEVPALAIHDANRQTVLKIETNGKMMWLPQGSTDLVELDVEKDLGIAFALCIEKLSGMSSKDLLEGVRAKAVQDKATKIADDVTQYLIDLNHIKPDNKDVHVKNITTIINGI